MNQTQAQKRIHKLREEILRANAAYFDQDREIIPESVRDQLKRELIELETQYPKLITPDSPTQRVGTPLSGKLPKIEHKKRKYSLQDAFDAEDLREFDTRVKRFLSLDAIQYSCEFKIDGLNITLWYEAGQLKKALTRGDGQSGEDVTHTIRTIQNLPLTLPQNLDLEVSGEVFIKKADFKKINNLNNSFKNARNLAAGTVRQLDPQVAADRQLQLFLYDIAPASLTREGGGGDGFTQSQLFDYFQTLKLPHSSDLKICSDIEAVIDFCQSFDKASAREKFTHDIDGIVIKVHDFALRKRLGYTAKTARYAIAWKFPATEKYTRLRAITYQVGRTGAITPVAELDPIDIDGSTVSRATLHNREELERKGVKIDDTVIVRKAGDIIPEVVEVLTDFRDGTQKDIIFPTLCPECQALLNAEEIITRCPNFDCPARHREGLYYFANTLKIEGLGPSTIDGLLELGFLKAPPDLWRLTMQDLAMVPLFKEKKILKLLQALEDKKRLTLAELLTALGIPLIGKENAQIISQYLRHQYGEINLQTKAFENLRTEEFEHIDGIGTKVAESFLHFITSPSGQNLLKDLTEVGIALSWPKIKTQHTGPLSGKKILITGSFEEISRDELKKQVIDNGGKILSSVSGNLDILIVGAKPGSKLKKAQDLGIEIWETSRINEVLGISSAGIAQEDEPQKSLF